MSYDMWLLTNGLILIINDKGNIFLIIIHEIEGGNWVSDIIDVSCIIQWNEAFVRYHSHTVLIL
jgi:hypothetical protein